MTTETYDLGDGRIMTNVHPVAQCEGRTCAIHNPSQHKMRDWRVNMRETGLMERLCKHGVGHPDPDSVWYLKNVRGWNGYELHGCDGCCAGDA